VTMMKVIPSRLFNSLNSSGGGAQLLVERGEALVECSNTFGRKKEKKKKRKKGRGKRRRGDGLRLSGHRARGGGEGGGGEKKKQPNQRGAPGIDLERDIQRASIRTRYCPAVYLVQQREGKRGGGKGGGRGKEEGSGARSLAVKQASAFFRGLEPSITAPFFFLIRGERKKKKGRKGKGKEKKERWEKPASIRNSGMSWPRPSFLFSAKKREEGRKKKKGRTEVTKEQQPS